MALTCYRANEHQWNAVQMYSFVIWKGTDFQVHLSTMAFENRPEIIIKIIYRRFLTTHKKSLRCTNLSKFEPHVDIYVYIVMYL